MTGDIGAYDPRCNSQKGLVPNCIRTYIKMKYKDLIWMKI